VKVAVRPLILLLLLIAGVFVSAALVGLSALANLATVVVALLPVWCPLTKTVVRRSRSTARRHASVRFQPRRLIRPLTFIAAIAALAVVLAPSSAPAPTRPVVTAPPGAVKHPAASRPNQRLSATLTGCPETPPAVPGIITIPAAPCSSADFARTSNLQYVTISGR
jgi:hypothetical protein